MSEYDIDYAEELQRVERELSSLRVKYHNLREILHNKEMEISTLKTNLKQINASKNDYISFMELVCQKLGKRRGWQSEYCRQTKTKLNSIQQWRKNGYVPYEVINSIVVLRHAPTEKRIKWTDVEYHRLNELHKTKSNIEIAEILSNEFGRSISETTIKAAITRLVKGKIK